MAATADHLSYASAGNSGLTESVRPLFSPLDIAGMVAAIVMALGPLTAFTLGL